METTLHISISLNKNIGRNGFAMLVFFASVSKYYSECIQSEILFAMMVHYSMESQHELAFIIAVPVSALF